MKNLPQKLPACCFLFLLLTAASVFSAELPKTITGVVTRVADGDTIYVLDKSETEHTIRLDGIDAPERNQDFAAQSKKYLSDLVLGEQVTVYVTKRDRNLRTVGRLWKSEMDVEYEMVAAGMAWHFDKFNNEQKLADARQAAGESKIGLWVYENPIPPQEWRRGVRPEKSPDTSFWLSKENVLHNENCRFYGVTKGFYCGESNAGRDCKKCGGRKYP